MSKRKSTTREVTEALVAKLKAGESKHTDKGNGDSKNHIYSFKTLRTYLDQCVRFTKYCKETHGCRTLEEGRQYADEYLQKLLDEGKSPYTLKTIRSALAKLYGEPGKNFTVDIPKRRRKDIKRSRGPVAMDAHFNPEKHQALITFCKATGLRRMEVSALRGTDFIVHEGYLYVIVRRGKGGKKRLVPVLPEYTKQVHEMMVRAGEGKVFKVIPAAMDVHSYRAGYTDALYRLLARPIEEIPKKERYYCRCDRKGVILDRTAMLLVSRALGHNRIGVMAAHYLHNPS